MTLYHKVSRQALDDTLAHGLKRALRGELGVHDMIAATDRFLDERRSTKLRAGGISRDNAVYAYLGTDQSLISIEDGQDEPLAKHLQQGDCLLKLTVDPKDCYVSDLDQFDAVKQALETEQPELAEERAVRYWDTVTPLPLYENGTFRRPEIIITKDISPDALTVVVR